MKASRLKNYIEYGVSSFSIGLVWGIAISLFLINKPLEMVAFSLSFSASATCTGYLVAHIIKTASIRELFILSFPVGLFFVFLLSCFSYIYSFASQSPQKFMDIFGSLGILIFWPVPCVVPFILILITTLNLYILKKIAKKTGIYSVNQDASNESLHRTEH